MVKKDRLLVHTLSLSISVILSNCGGTQAGDGNAEHLERQGGGAKSFAQSQQTTLDLSSGKRIRAESYDLGATYVIGYFPEKDVTPRALQSLRGKPLWGGSVYEGEDWDFRTPVALRVETRGKDSPDCVLLLQIAVRNGVEAPKDMISEIVRYNSNQVAQGPLSSSCERIKDKPDTNVASIPFQHGDDFLLESDLKSCVLKEAFASEAFRITPASKIHYSMHYSGSQWDKMADRPKGEFLLKMHIFDPFEQGFSFLLPKGDAGRSQILTGSLDRIREDDIRLTATLVEDPAEGILCLVADLKQSELHQRLVYRFPLDQYLSHKYLGMRREWSERIKKAGQEVAIRAQES